MNRERRDRLRDAAIGVLADSGSRGLTHRAVDRAAELPIGTAKNYFPTRDALLRAVAERCDEHYRAVPTSEPSDRESLAAMLTGLLDDAAGPGSARVLAIHELRCEAARRPWLAEIVDGIVAADFTDLERAQRQAGLPVNAERAAAVTLALHGALAVLYSRGERAFEAAGLAEPDRFVRDLLETVYPS